MEEEGVGGRAARRGRRKRQAKDSKQKKKRRRRALFKVPGRVGALDAARRGGRARAQPAEELRRGRAARGVVQAGDLGHQPEVDAVGALDERVDLGVGEGLLAAKVGAGEAARRGRGGVRR